MNFTLRTKRDVVAAKAFSGKAIRDQGQSSETNALDGYAASHRAVREVKADGLLPEDAKVRSSKYLNNLRTGPSPHQIQNERDAQLQTARERRDHDFRHRVGASHSQGSVRSLEAQPQGCRCARRMGCRPVRSIKCRTNRTSLNRLCTRTPRISEV
ncbi:DDE-type integrase/transposase/recombinase [Paraburkholderia sp. LEh10]|nr:DDE-type integrase/transposase/recombinase [Paraburkholderia sp. LEh10]